MSRNLQHKSPSRAGKKTPSKRSQRSDYSSDDDYAGVDLITDSEEDEPDVELAEEEAIIESEEEDDGSLAAPQPSIDDDHSSWGGFDIDDQFMNDQAFFDEHMGRTENTYSTATEDDSRRSSKVQIDSGSDSDTAQSDGNSFFPDIFLDMDHLDRGFRRSLEKDNPDDDADSSDGSFWDFDENDGAVPAESDHGLVIEADKADKKDTEGDKEGDKQGNGEGDKEGDNQDDNQSDGESSVGSSSGYETDDGETTEEDLPPAARFVPARSILRRDSNSSSSTDEDDIPTIRRNPYRPLPASRANSKNGPKLYSWKHDASKPFAVMDSRGKKLIMFKARVARQFNFDNEFRTPVPAVGDSDLDLNTLDQMSPMISNSANLMMSAMYTPLDQANGQALGPPEAFYPFSSVDPNGAIDHEDQSSYDEEDLDDEDLWNIGDFLDFGDSSSDEEGDGQDIEGASPSRAGTPASTARSQRATTETASHPLLDHFDRGVVGAFRKNQTRHQLLSRNAASRDSLAFSGPYRQGPIRGIKGGRLAAANTPITPMRKQKGVKQVIASSPGSPLAQGKRKFSSAQQESSKRNRH